LVRKLKRFEEAEGELNRALDELEAKDFISAARVVMSTLHQKAPRFGAARVLQTLKNKGIDRDRLAQAAENLKDTELERAMLVWQRKFKTPFQSPAEYAKQARFMAVRGFSGDVVARVLKLSQQTSE
jgi:regulatory protein